ncbi:hypothetical protein CH63R_08340 [Colletotrichum higginsianum IMI 349063]|uniref:SnoaL-like domain-containing protein n=1 Tax=Colletotrichum higginsianum (strain IMI 349063) TaxID=759273 RepID=A0A1B7YC76_COLHI|nr:hypothetical protein CH63R_08340 [Colletotrichum higginsianum IMI 349063]OBR09575.1 hypothetical protein CH63R_08340 [Colletotrichum higginsianum IMI 349063]GJC96351.1 hypothetical protein ColKHC_05177 [Colletotrichum higginsianum]
MDISSQEKFERFVAEMRGDSQDTPLRPALESNFKYILDKSTKTKFTEDITLVFDTTNIGGILKGKQELVSYFKEEHQVHARIITVPITTIVDRGRITCYADQYFYHGDDGMKRTTLIICDLDDSQLIERMEYRKVKEDEEFQGIEGDFMEERSREKDMTVQYGI